jgi:acetolactate synthase regulatory subunit
MTRHFSLLVDDRPETLMRVTGLCLRRRADVVALRYARSRGGRAGFARLELELAVSERHGHGLAERLGALVEVRDVAELRSTLKRSDG